MTYSFTVRCRNHVERLMDGRMYRPVVELGTADAGQPLATDATKTAKDLLSFRPAGKTAWKVHKQPIECRPCAGLTAVPQ